MSLSQKDPGLVVVALGSIAYSVAMYFAYTAGHFGFESTVVLFLCLMTILLSGVLWFVS